MDNLIQIPLTLPDRRILPTQRTEQGHWLIHVESTLDGAQCRRCGREIRGLHGLDAVMRLCQLSLIDVPAVLEIRPTQYRRPCQAVHPTTMQRCAWYEQRNPNVQAYEPWALCMVLTSTAADVARMLGVWHGGLLYKFVVAGASAVICSPSLQPCGGRGELKHRLLPRERSCPV
jgi:hypothetical protein